MRGKINITAIIKEAWGIVWKNRILWLFGFFAFILAPAGEIESILLNSLELGQSSFIGSLWGIIKESKILTIEGLSGIAIILSKEPIFLLSVLGVYFLIFVLGGGILLFSAVCHTALIHHSFRLIEGKPAKLNFSFKFGIKKFWPVLLVDLIFIIFSGILFYILGTLVNGNSVVFVIAFIFFGYLIAVVSLITKFVLNYIVIDNLPVAKSYLAGFSLLNKNWFNSLKLSLFLFFINIILILLLFLILFVGQMFVLFISIILATFKIFGLEVKLLIIFLSYFLTGVLIVAISTSLNWMSWVIYFESFKKIKHSRTLIK